MADVSVSASPSNWHLDRWIREARARLKEAQRGGDPSCIAAASAAVRELEENRLMLDAHGGVQ